MTSPGPGLSASVEADGPSVHVVFSGRFDVVGAVVAREVLRSAQRRAADLHLDLSGVDAIDAAGLGVLVAGIRRAASTGGSLSISRASDAIQHAFRVVGLTGVLETSLSSQPTPNGVKARLRAHE